MTTKRTLGEVLQSTSESLFPAELGKAKVKINSTDCDGDTPLHVLIWRGDTEGAILLISNGAPIDAIGDMGETPLHVAIAKKDTRIISALIEAGAKTDIVSEFGETAIQKAAKHGISIRRNT
jgi:ankyrin repeat protein